MNWYFNISPPIFTCLSFWFYMSFTWYLLCIQVFEKSTWFYSLPNISFYMVTLLLSLHHLLPFLTSAFYLSTAVISSTDVTTKPSRLVTKLIHRNSYLHPLYDPNETVEDRSKREETSSTERFAYLESKIKELNSVGGNEARANLIPFNQGSGFLVNFSIGQPPVMQLAVVDTGSSLLWVQCLPCVNCFRQSGSWFDPLKSWSFKILDCDFPGHNYVRGYKCNDFHQAEYKLRYLGGDTSEGILAKESLLFETPDEGTLQPKKLMNNLVFFSLKTKKSYSTWQIVESIFKCNFLRLSQNLNQLGWVGGSTK